MTPKEILTAARALIETPETWIKFSPARTEQDEDVAYDSPTAVKFCAMGALYRASTPIFRGDGTEWSAAHTVCLRTLRAQINDEAISSYNDRMEHSAVLNMFSAAINAL